MSALYWVRNDLRISDNLTLLQFCKNESIGAFIWCPTSSTLRAGVHRHNFLTGHLRKFSEQLEKNQQKLLCSPHSFLKTLQELFRLPTANPLQRIYFTREFAYEEVHEEQAVIKLCQDHGVEVIGFDQNTLINEADLPFKIYDMPFVFTAFRKEIEKDFKVAPVQATPVKWPRFLTLIETAVQFNLPQDFAQIKPHNSSLSQRGFTEFFQPGEEAAQLHLQNYLYQTQALTTYKETRNGMLNWHDSSKLSLWLNYGALSARTVFQEVKNYEKLLTANESTYWLIFELLWRDYFKFFSRKYREKIFLIGGVQALKPQQHQLNQNSFLNWCKGQTSSDFVNAHMRELNTTGWMSNRGRQNVASFLIHDLGLPWTWGAAYFEKQLIDYDPDLNWGNWLYLSGQGSDPRSRIFNVERQAQMYDAEGLYRKKWLTAE